MTEDCQRLVISGRYTADEGHFVKSSWSAARQNKVIPSSLLCYIFYEWQKQKKWIHGKSTLSNYWDASKVKRSKTVSQQLPSLFPLDVWNVTSFPALIWAQSTGEAPQVTRAGSLDCRARLSERDRCVIEDSQPWPTGMPDSLGGFDKQLPDLCMRTHTATCFHALYNNLVERSFIFSLGTLGAILLFSFHLLISIFALWNEACDVFMWKKGGSMC